ncbi:hypothetical protein MMC30_002590 [Trapelia coarctata]|nr:hypothetical protein [Trapelia coarctata]
MARTTQRGRGRPSKASRSIRANDAQASVIPGVYQEMLAEATSSSPTRLGEEGQTVKRRRIGGRIVTQGEKASSGARSSPDRAGTTEGDDRLGDIADVKQQTAYNDSEDSGDSDVAWENVSIKDEGKEESSEESRELDLVLGGGGNASMERRRTHRRKPATAAERELRVEVHKMHLVSLLVHVGLRNHWCNDHDIQVCINVRLSLVSEELLIDRKGSLRRLLSKKTLLYLDDDENQSQFQRSRSFIDGLQHAIDAFGSRYKITARGLQRPYWAENEEQLLESSLPDDVDLPMQKEDFRAVAADLKASRDVGAQLFCALLRSVGVEARLICSLQVLPFVATVRSTTPVKPKPAFTIEYPDTRTGISDDESGADAGSDSSARPAGSSSGNGLTSRVRSRLGGPGRLHQVAPIIASPNIAPLVKQTPRKRIRESPKPVYWVEAFSEAYQKWVPVDPLVTKTIAKPSRFEPPASDADNSMIYVIAFEEDGSARDVTRRYTKAYNAKTRKSRVEVTNGGGRWWRRVSRLYRRVHALSRDQVEDAELAAKEAAEPMPSNVQDFKDHPYYALERHLRRNEVIHPKREAGKVKAGKSGAGGGNKALEPVYRRQDVHIVKSADSWYRLGREIKTGEQPLKRVQPRRRREAVSEEDISGDEENAGTPMYAGFQTIPFTAPPVVRGIVPKNAYGNLDIYVPSMVPPGGTHILHPDTARAAKLLGIHYADAVTGFEFRGRHGTALIKGAVVASEYRPAVEEVIRGFEYERAEEEGARRSSNALRMWRMFLKGLRIRERIKGYEIEGESSEIKKEMEDVDREEEDGIGGGFVPDADDDVEAAPTAGQRFEHLSQSDAEEGGEFVEDNSDSDDRTAGKLGIPWTEMPQAATQDSGDDLGGGGFLVEDRESDGLEDEDAMEALRDINRSPIFTETTCQVEQEDVLADSNSIEEAPSRVSLFDHGLPEHEFAEAKRLQQIFENEVSKSEGRSNDPGEADADVSPIPLPNLIFELSQNKDALEISKEEKAPRDSSDTNGPPQLDQEVSLEGASALAVVSDEESGTDKGSLLSHDPSDEDADPDWLV